MKSYHDIAGDGGSNVLGQVLELREKISARLEGVRHLIAVGSGKGGVGKSTLTMRLADALAETGSRVSVLDADFNGPTQAKLAGLSEAPLLPGDDGLAIPRNASGIGVVSMGSLFAAGEAVDFDSVSSGESHTWRATREFAALSELLSSIEWGVQDFLLVDLPPGAERTFQFAEYFGARAQFVLVTIPSEVSYEVVARSVDALGKAQARVLGHVENMAGYYCDGCEAVKPLFAPARVPLTTPCLGQIPFDPRLAALCDRGESLSQLDASAPAAAIRQLAARIKESLEEQ